MHDFLEATGVPELLGFPSILEDITLTDDSIPIWKQCVAPTHQTPPLRPPECVGLRSSAAQCPPTCLPGRATLSAVDTKNGSCARDVAHACMCGHGDVCPQRAKPAACAHDAPGAGLVSTVDAGSAHLVSALRLLTACALFTVAPCAGGCASHLKGT